MEQLTVIEKEGANYKLYELVGALTAYTLGEFSKKLYEDVLKINVVLDMSKLTELDPSGIGVLMAAFNDAQDVGTTLYFLSMSNEASIAVTNTGFKTLFNIITSVTEIK